jgi:hypothetical protein
MSEASSSLTTSTITAQATLLLEVNGYRRLEERRVESLSTLGARLFEDAYGIVALIVFETWAQLWQRWPDAQDGLVELISANLSRSDAKAWDGYLVLLTPSAPPKESNQLAEEIRYNTSRVRKLVATGDELHLLTDIDRCLSPLLPLELDVSGETRGSALDALPALLDAKGVSERLGSALVEAFQRQESLFERLHKEAG